MESTELSLWNKIYLWWKYEVKYYPSRIKDGVSNLIKWFPIIWRDRDYDSHYLLEIMKFKINQMSKLQESLNLHSDSKRNVEIMNTILRLLDKVQEEHYRHEYYDYLETRYKFIHVDETEYHTVEEEIIRDDSEEYIKKYPLTFNQVTSHKIYKETLVIREKIQLKTESDEDDRRLIPMIMGEIRHEKAKKLMLKLINKNIEKW